MYIFAELPPLRFAGRAKLGGGVRRAWSREGGDDVDAIRRRRSGKRMREHVTTSSARTECYGRFHHPLGVLDGRNNTGFYALRASSTVATKRRRCRNMFVRTSVSQSVLPSVSPYFRQSVRSSVSQSVRQSLHHALSFGPKLWAYTRSADLWTSVLRNTAFNPLICCLWQIHCSLPLINSLPLLNFG